MERLPPTIITAPTSLIAAPKPATIPETMITRASRSTSHIVCQREAPRPIAWRRTSFGTEATPPIVMAAITGAAMKNSAMIIAVGV
jgi:hypothetical protein